MEQKKIDLWIEYDSYGDYINGRDIIADTYEEAIKELSNFENKPDYYSGYPEVQIIIMITDYDLHLSKAFYDVDVAIEYCKSML